MKITNVTTIALFVPSLNKTVEPGGSIDIPDSMANDFKDHAFFALDKPMQTNTSMAQSEPKTQGV